jgi:hypothetical protein
VLVERFPDGRLYVQLDAVEGPPVAVPGQQRRSEGVRRMFPWGYDARPPAGAEGVAVAPMGGSQSFLVGADHPQHKPDFDDSEWSTIMHNEVAGTWVKLRADGGVRVEGKGGKVEVTKDGKITVDAAQNQDVVVNSGTLKVARDTDPVRPSSEMQAFLTATITLLNGLAPGTITPAQAVALQISIGKISGGAAHFKG